MAVSPSATAACHTLGRSVAAEGRAPEMCGAAAAQDVIFAAASREAPTSAPPGARPQRRATRARVPRAVTLPRPLQHLQMPAPSDGETRRRVKRATDLRFFIFGAMERRGFRSSISQLNLSRFCH